MIDKIKSLSVIMSLLILSACSNKTVSASHINLEVALDSNYNTVSTSVFVDGQKVETVVLNNDNEIAGYAYREYNDSGQQIKVSKFDSNKELKEMCTIEWLDGISSNKTCYLKDGTIRQEVTSVVEDNKIIERILRLENGYVVYNFEYDSDGRMVKMIDVMYDSDGSVFSNCYTDYEYSGNKKIAYNYEDGKKAYTYKNVYTYDDLRRLVKGQSYTEKDKLLLSFKYTYHDNNLIKSFESKDDTEKRLEKYNSYGALTYIKNNYVGTVYKAK